MQHPFKIPYQSHSAQEYWQSGEPSTVSRLRIRCAFDDGRQGSLRFMLEILLISVMLVFALKKLCCKRADVIFFHPFCSAGGGGERVLWTAIMALQAKKSNLKIIIVAENNADADEDIIRKANNKFALNVEASGIGFARLRLCKLIRDSTYPRLTLLLQSLGSLLLGCEAALRIPSGTIVDTMGCAFAYPALAICGHRIIAYVHYPFISKDMIERVEKGVVSYNNSEMVKRSRLLTKAKVLYYQSLHWLYSQCGSLVELALVNSTWTQNHIKESWKTAIMLLYPPCDVDKFNQTNTLPRKPQIVSLSQFRPEKNHELQLKAFAKFMSKYGNTHLALILVGGCRDDSDRQRVVKLKTMAKDLGIGDKVRFEVNAPFELIQSVLHESLIGLHTMVDEHFGISIVEFMAAGLITIANNSGGPKSDIIEHGFDGFRASTDEEYAELFQKVLVMEEKDRATIRSLARQKAMSKFSNESFMTGFQLAVFSAK